MTPEAEMRGDIRAKLQELADKIDALETIRPSSVQSQADIDRAMTKAAVIKSELIAIAIDIFAGTLGDVASIAISLRTIAAINAKNEEGPLLDITTG
jgi:hypothetical protein